jgi:hypothetical protein
MRLTPVPVFDGGIPDSSALVYKGTWDASANIPLITSSVGIAGDYYIVSVAGTTMVDGINDWGVNDWIIFNGFTWEKIDNSEKAGFALAVSPASFVLNGFYYETTVLASQHILAVVLGAECFVLSGGVRTKIEPAEVFVDNVTRDVTIRVLTVPDGRFTGFVTVIGA